MTPRLMSALMIAAGTATLLLAELDKFPPKLHPWIVGGAAILLALSQSAQKVVSGKQE